MKKPQLTLEQDIAAFIIGNMGTALLDIHGNPNVILIKTLFDLNEVPPEMQSQMMKDIMIICDEIRNAARGKQNPTHH